MYCEICGKRARKRVLVSVRGANLRVCAECAKGQTRAKIQASAQDSFPAKPMTLKSRVQLPPTRREPPRPKEVPELSLRPMLGYGQLIHRTREGKGITVEDFSRLVGIRESLIRKIESEKITPSISDLRRIERALGVRLVEQYSEEEGPTGIGGTTTVTLGEAAELRGLDERGEG